MVLRDSLPWAGSSARRDLVRYRTDQGEPVNAAWLVVAVVCIYFIAYRFYAVFIANRVVGFNASARRPLTDITMALPDPWPHCGRACKV